MSLFTDLSTITTIPVSTLKKLSDKVQLCILHRFYENELKNESITNIDMGIGYLYILHAEDELKYKFIPAKNFEAELKNIVQKGDSPLISTVEKALKEKIMNAYKDLL